MAPVYERVNGASATSQWPPQVAPPTLSERRQMKKAAQPEHSYTGYIPKWIQETIEPAVMEAQQHKKYAPILGYSGHLRHDEDRIGTTFTKGLDVARHPEPAHAGPLTRSDNNKSTPPRASPKKHVTFHEQQVQPKPSAMSKRSGYGQFDGASGYGEFAAPLRSGAGGSGYGAFDGASGYGEFQAKPMSARSGYGAFDGASGYGEFQAKPMSARSGYGAFDGASGYGEFQAKPMSARSGYGAFDGTSGYGEFQAKPMSARSGYGAFDEASGYGEFQAPPPQPRGGGGRDTGGATMMSARSGYGEFDGASGYGDFGAHGNNAKMSAGSEYGEFDGASGYGDFLAKPEEEERGGGGQSPRSDDSQGYGAFEGASGYGEFMAAPETNHKEPKPKNEPARIKEKGNKTRVAVVIKVNDALDRQYKRALEAVGGAQRVNRLLDAFAVSIAQRHHKRTELLQALKRNFDTHERENRGQMTKAHVKETLHGLSCVFTDDQIMALMSRYDPECRGTVPMDALLTDLSRRIMSLR